MRLLQEGTIFGRSVRRVLQLAWPVATRMEEACFGREGPSRPPLFIVGLPRAGTTLIAQTICHCLKVSYLPELANFVPFAPAFASWASRKSQPQYRSTFSSHYGTSPGLASPAEGVTWNLWFEKDRFYEHPEELPEPSRRALSGMVGRIERIGQGPFVNKNLRNNNRVRLLAELFPDAMFLIVLRRPIDVATSLLIGRRDLAGGVGSWFSIKPRDYESFRNAEPVVQIARQVGGLVRDLADDIAVVGASRFSIVSYEDFCREPRGFLDDLSRFLGPAAQVFERIQDPPPNHRVSSANRSLDRAQIDGLCAAIDRYVSADLYDSLNGAWLARASD